MSKDLLTQAVQLLQHIEQTNASNLDTKTQEALAGFNDAARSLSPDYDMVLMAQIVRNKALSSAPYQITLSEGHYCYDLGIGADHTATLIIHKRALAQLNRVLSQDAL